MLYLRSKGAAHRMALPDFDPILPPHRGKLRADFGSPLTSTGAPSIRQTINGNLWRNHRMNDAFAFSRRHFIKVAAAGLALSQTLEAKKMINSRIHGVYVGLQTFSLRGLRYDAVIPAMKQVG